MRLHLVVEGQTEETFISYPRFIPYVQLHEFEALLFSDPQSFAIAFPDMGPKLAELQVIRRAAEFHSAPAPK
jgi:hypothetical protein